MHIFSPSQLQSNQVDIFHDIPMVLKNNKDIVVLPSVVESQPLATIRKPPSDIIKMRHKNIALRISPPAVFLMT